MLRVLFALVLLTTSLTAQTSGAYYEALTVSTVAVGFSTNLVNNLAILGPLVSCRGRLETAAIRVRHDGTDPTSGEGVLIDVDSQVVINGFSAVQSFRAIRTAGTNAVLRVHCGQF